MISRNKWEILLEFILVIHVQKFENPFFLTNLKNENFTLGVGTMGLAGTTNGWSPCWRFWSAFMLAICS